MNRLKVFADDDGQKFRTSRYKTMQENVLREEDKGERRFGYSGLGGYMERAGQGDFKQ